METGIGSMGSEYRRFRIDPEALPLVNAFGVWLDEQCSRLGEKLTYIANRWGGLLAFLYDGRVEIDSNFVENRICPLKTTESFCTPCSTV